MRRQFDRWLAEGRSPHGERGLKYETAVESYGNVRRSPHGERGLKSHDINHGTSKLVSLSSWRAWIEIDNRGV